MTARNGTAQTEDAVTLVATSAATSFATSASNAEDGETVEKAPPGRGRDFCTCTRVPAAAIAVASVRKHAAAQRRVFVLLTFGTSHRQARVSKSSHKYNAVLYLCDAWIKRVKPTAKGERGRGFATSSLQRRWHFFKFFVDQLQTRFSRKEKNNFLVLITNERCPFNIARDICSPVC